MNRRDMRRRSIIHNNCNYALLSDGSFGERTPVVVNIGGGRTDVRGTSEINRSHGDFVGSKPYRSSAANREASVYMFKDLRYKHQKGLQ